MTMNAITFRGPGGVATYRAIALKHGLKLYADCGIQPNRAWTPMAMLATAGQITGKTYKRGQYAQAIADLTAWINVNGTLGD
jgi:hypothetical protein